MHELTAGETNNTAVSGQRRKGRVLIRCSRVFLEIL